MLYPIVEPDDARDLPIDHGRVHVAFAPLTPSGADGGSARGVRVSDG
jgi:hypothetical protein